jgi:hypothetical protein
MDRRSAINRRVFVSAFAALAALAGIGSAAAATYRYRCPKCKLIQEYGAPGVKKCPNDGRTMIRQN